MNQGGFRNLLHVPQLRMLDLQSDTNLGRTAEVHLGSCLARLAHLQASAPLQGTGGSSF